jgi:hypothetical protein
MPSPLLPRLPPSPFDYLPFFLLSSVFLAFILSSGVDLISICITMGFSGRTSGASHHIFMTSFCWFLFDLITCTALGFFYDTMTRTNGVFCLGFFSFLRCVLIGS